MAKMKLVAKIVTRTLKAKTSRRPRKRIAYNVEG
jgi:hypothetical protein